MSKRPSGNSNTGVQLFPFLAVLLCTMGALILLLMLIAQQARSQAEAETARAAVKPPEVDTAELERRRDDLDWKAKQLAVAREKTLADLAAHRAQLSHLEEHSQRLRRQLSELDAARQLLGAQSTATVVDRAQLEAELAQLNAQIAAAKDKLAKAKAAGQKPQAFAVVPYDGQNGTRRRPIYIECRGDAVVLQPEGIVFREADFAGSMGPSNPLASCVRVVSEYLTRSANYQEGEQPYPLLLVRPSGIGAYYAARAAMSSWDSEFGYELVNEDWPLEFPPADPLLNQMLAKTLEEARIRQVMIARAAPSLRNKRSKPSFRIAPSGHGLVQEQGSGGGDAYGSADGRYSSERGPGGGSGDGPHNARDESRYAQGSGNSTGPRYGDLAGGGGIGGAGTGLGGAGIGDGLGGGSETGTMPGTSGGGVPNTSPATMGGPALGGPALGGTSGTGNGTGTAEQSAGGGATSGPFADGPGFAGAPGSDGGGSGQPGGTSQSGGPGQYGNNTPGAGPAGDGSVAAAGPGGYGTAAAEGAGGTSGGTATRGAPGGGGGSPIGSAASPFAPSGGGSPSGGGAASAADPNGGGTPTLAVNVPPGPGEYVESMARKRGKNWGLPESSRSSTPLTRPIQMYCSADQLTLFSDRGVPDKQIPLSGRTEESVDTLVSQVWDHVKVWGIAGRGMYWKPVLSIHVAPDGTARFNELKRLLEGSGLEVVGKQITVAAPAGSTGRR